MIVYSSPKGVVTHERNGTMHIVATYRRNYNGTLQRPLSQSVVSQHSLHSAETEIKDHIWQLKNDGWPL